LKANEHNKPDIIFLNKDMSIFSTGLQGVYFLDLAVCFLAFFFYVFLHEIEWFCLFPSIFRFDADIYITDFFVVFLSFIDSVFFEMLYLDIFWEEGPLMAIPQQGELDFFVYESAFDTNYVIGELNRYPKWFNVSDWWHEDYEEHFDFWGSYTYEDQTNDDDEVGFDPYPVYNLSSMAYYDDSPSKNFSRAFFGVDYLNPYDNRHIDRIKWHMNRLDFVKYKVRYMHRRYMLFLEELIVEMDQEEPDPDKPPRHDMYARNRFLRRHRLNVLKNI